MMYYEGMGKNIETPEDRKKKKQLKKHKQTCAKNRAKRKKKR